MKNPSRAKIKKRSKDAGTVFSGGKEAAVGRKEKSTKKKSVRKRSGSSINNSPPSSQKRKKKMLSVRRIKAMSTGLGAREKKEMFVLSPEPAARQACRGWGEKARE